jgi:hypothetical protein
MDMNPYEGPNSDATATSSVVAGAVDEASLEALAATRGWAMFLGVLGFIGAGFMVIGALLMLALGALGPGLSGGDGSGLDAFNAPMFFGLGGLYLVLAVTWIYPSLSLSRYASRIGVVVISKKSSDLAPALEAQRSFFRFLGAFAIAMIVLYGLAIAGAIVLPMLFNASA